MKTIKITYWITSAIIAVMMAYSAFAYVTKPEIIQSFHHIGFPDYFRTELAIAKALGAIVLLVPVWSRVKEWAYAGFGIAFISAFIAHTASGDPVGNRIAPLAFLALLIASYLTYHKLPKA